MTNVKKKRFYYYYYYYYYYYVNIITNIIFITFFIIRISEQEQFTVLYEVSCFLFPSIVFLFHVFWPDPHDHHLVLTHCLDIIIWHHLIMVSWSNPVQPSFLRRHVLFTCDSIHLAEVLLVKISCILGLET